MARQVSNAVSASVLEVLLSQLAQARTVGTVVWSKPRPVQYMGKLDVTTALEQCPSGELRIHWVTPRPDRIHIQYLVNNAAIRRLDVNDNHKKLQDTTHKHRYVPGTGREDAYVPEDIPEVPLSPTVALDTYRRVFEAFARECCIELVDGYWTQPRRC